MNPEGIHYNPETNGIEVSSPKVHDTMMYAAKEGLRYVPAPMMYFTGEVGVIPHGQVLGVWCREDEDVVWLWNDWSVYGYNIERA